jgi:hypothetical protein
MPVEVMLRGIIRNIHENKLEAAVEDALALRDEDLAPLIREQDRRDGSCENDPPQYHPDRGRALVLHRSLPEIIGQLRRRRPDQAVVSVEAALAAWKPQQ